jgi:hypothetical protein
MSLMNHQSMDLQKAKYTAYRSSWVSDSAKASDAFSIIDEVTCLHLDRTAPYPIPGKTYLSDVHFSTLVKRNVTYMLFPWPGWYSLSLYVYDKNGEPDAKMTFEGY